MLSRLTASSLKNFLTALHKVPAGISEEQKSFQGAPWHLAAPYSEAAIAEEKSFCHCMATNYNELFPSDCTRGLGDGLAVNFYLACSTPVLYDLAQVAAK